MITPLRPTTPIGPAPQRISRRRRRTVPPALFSGTLFRRRPRLEAMEDRTLLSTFVVSNTGDSGPGSLRQAILDSNHAAGATNSIDFDISGSSVQTIAPLSPLPAISRPVLIDGRSQPGYSRTPLIELSGTNIVSGDGLLITAPNVAIRGLDVNNFSQGAGIHITGTSATGDWIYGNFLGTDPSGTQAEPNNEGTETDGGASGNLIGTNGDGIGDAAERNLISGNLSDGVWINGPGTDGNAVAGNFIGASVSGDAALDNGTPYAFVYGGVVIDGGASGNRVGTDGRSVDDGGQRNIIAGSDNDGVDIIGAGTDGNVVAGNFIGTDVSGTRSMGIAAYGVFLSDAAHNWIGVNPLGGTAFGDEGNVISGTGSGIQLDQSDDNVIAGDLIGTDVTGAAALGNRSDGVAITNMSSGNTIGGTSAGEADVISGNGTPDSGDWGVEFNNASDNVVEGDFIGTDATGTKSLGNAGAGVSIFDLFGTPSTGNTIGGTSAMAGNLVTNNGGPGVVVYGDSTSGNQVTANRIFGNTGQAIDLGDDGVTDNSSSPRQGPDNLQNFPVIAATAEGQYEGWLGGSAPDMTFRVDLFASAGYGPGGAGEAQDYLGSLEVTTSSQGQALFDVPFTPPAGLPMLTATATDSEGNTSEVSALRRATVEAQPLRLGAGQPPIFSAEFGNQIALQDPDAGSLDPAWDLQLSVADGTLALSTLDGLVGTGNGTSMLRYQGSLSALNAALEGMAFTATTAISGNTTLTLSAESVGAPTLTAHVIITDGLFAVTTTADNGPGSLRQAILDSNAATGGRNTIDFGVSSPGVQIIAPRSPLPALTNPVLIDGFSEQGYAGTPVIELSGSQAGSADGLTITGSDVTVRGLDINAFATGAGILITGTTATDNTIEANDIGTDPTGLQALPNGFGVQISGGASKNLVGGISAAAGNLIAFNPGPGVDVEGDGSVGNQITANRIFSSAAPAPRQGALQFDGSSDVGLPDYLMQSAFFQPQGTIEASFQTTRGGVILGDQGSPADSQAQPASDWLPVLYVGSDGKLYAELSAGSPKLNNSDVVVNDGRWHNVALEYDEAAVTETLYLDGQRVGSLSGWYPDYVQSFSQIGTGYTFIGPSAQAVGTASLVRSTTCDSGAWRERRARSRMI